MTMTESNFKGLKYLLIKAGYKELKKGYRNEDSGWWKSFHDEAYQIGVLIYDFAKFEGGMERPVGVQFECIVSKNPKITRLDLIACDDAMTISEFEAIAETFYQSVAVKHLKIEKL